MPSDTLPARPRRHHATPALDVVRMLVQRQRQLDRLAPHLEFTRRRLEHEIAEFEYELAARRAQPKTRRSGARR